jgi:hypothetical protein
MPARQSGGERRAEAIEMVSPGTAPGLNTECYEAAKQCRPSKRSWFA